MKTGYDAHFKKIKSNNRFKVKATPMPIQKKRKKQNFPMIPVLASLFILCGAGYGYMNSEEVEQYLGKIDLDKIEIGFLGQADAEEKIIPHASLNSENTAGAKSLDAKNKKTEATGLSSEEVALFNSLDERKKQLDSKESDLKKLEEELHNQKVELEKRLVELEQLRTHIGNQLQERVAADAGQVDKLVAFYSSMKPQTAAKVFEKLNEDLAVEVLKKMKKKDAAEIMNMVESDKAQRLSEKFAGYKK